MASSPFDQNDSPVSEFASFASFSGEDTILSEPAVPDSFELLLRYDEPRTNLGENRNLEEVTDSHHFHHHHHHHQQQNTSSTLQLPPSIPLCQQDRSPADELLSFEATNEVPPSSTEPQPQPALRRSSRPNRSQNPRYKKDFVNQEDTANNNQPLNFEGTKCDIANMSDVYNTEERERGTPSSCSLALAKNKTARSQLVKSSSSKKTSPPSQQHQPSQRPFKTSPLGDKSFFSVSPSPESSPPCYFEESSFDFEDSYQRRSSLGPFVSSKDEGKEDMLRHDPLRNARMAKANREKKKAYIASLEERIQFLSERSISLEQEHVTQQKELAAAQRQVKQLQMLVQNSEALRPVLHLLSGLNAPCEGSPRVDEASSLMPQGALVLPLQLNIHLPPKETK